MPKSVTTYVALGSNLNDPIQQLQTAITALQQIPQTHLICISSFYQTAPVGVIDQPDFINAVACMETTLSAQDLLINLQQIENNQGRVRQQKNGPRTLDLDILLYGNAIISAPELTIPHPRMHERAFVLIPLLEIAPNAALPNSKLVKDLLKELKSEN